MPDTCFDELNVRSDEMVGILDGLDLAGAMPGFRLDELLLAWSLRGPGAYNFTEERAETDHES